MITENSPETVSPLRRGVPGEFFVAGENRERKNGMKKGEKIVGVVESVDFPNK